MHYFEPKFREEDRPERSIFEFSNLIGAFITFVLIQATNPKNNRIIDSKENVKRDELIQEWIKTVILPVIPHLAGEFRDSIYDALGKYQKYHERTRLMKRKSRFSISEFDSAEAARAFTRIYPLLGYELDKLMTELPRDTEWFKDSTEEIEEKWKKTRGL